MSTSDNTAYSFPSFPHNDRASQAWARVEPSIERMHDEFMGQWRQALSAIVPATVEIDNVSLECLSYAQFIKEAPAFSDIQVYEVESMQSLCAWSLDVGFVSAAVDCIFGGMGRIPARDASRRNRSPIETGVRRRLLESLATAYESVWQVIHPIRLNPLRQEALVSSLRLTATAEQVVYARIAVSLNQQKFAVGLCLPLRALDCLQPASELSSPQEPTQGSSAVTQSSVVPRLQETQVDVVAVLGELQLTVAQLMSLSIGQVVPFEMNDRVPLEVDGVRVVSGRSGMRNGHHAVKVDLSSALNLKGLPAEFTPLNDGLRASQSEVQAPEPVAADAQSPQTDAHPTALQDDPQP